MRVCVCVWGGDTVVDMSGGMIAGCHSPVAIPKAHNVVPQRGLEECDEGPVERGLVRQRPRRDGRSSGCVR